VPRRRGSYFAHFAEEGKPVEFGCKVQGPTIRRARSDAPYR